MKLKSVILTMLLSGYAFPAACMLPSYQNAGVVTDNHPSPEPEDTLGVFKYVPFAKQADMAVKNVEKAADAFKEGTSRVGESIEVSSLNLKAAVDELQKNGVKVSPDTIAELNKTGVSLMKVYLTAGIGGAIALTGLILLYKTIMQEKPLQEVVDTRPFYKRLLTNRYLLSGLLMASGIGVIVKSDSIVKTLT